MTQIFNKLHLDFAPRHDQPSAIRLALATIVSLAGSLIADAILVAIGERVFPSTRNYVHFQFSDYGKLTIIGVLIACIAWPIVTRITSAPRWMFFRMAILVTIVLWAPDIWILDHGSPAKAVAVLMVMHLAIAVATYNSLVHIAKVNVLPSESDKRALESLRNTSDPQGFVSGDRGFG